jgi:dual-specificity kinase/CDC-like kinase
VTTSSPATPTTTPHNNNDDNKRPSSEDNESRDDTIGHFQGGPGTVIAGRYKVIQDLGIGTFGRVVECLDLRRKNNNNRNDNNKLDRSRQRGIQPTPLAQQDEHRSDRVAIKIVRNVKKKKYYESALIEAGIVEEVNRRGGRGTSLCAILWESFTFNGHFCMVFESLGLSLYDFLKRHNYQPFPMVCIRDFAKQLLEALEFLHSFQLIHTDLKPENILLTNLREVTYRGYRVPESTRIKVIDFGGATYDYERKSSVVNTRQYRSPEVILGVGWSLPSDLWSAGCILAELYSGELLFATHDNQEHLALMERIIGPFPRWMIKRAKNTDLAHESFSLTSGRHRGSEVLSADSALYVKKMIPLDGMIRKQDARFLQLLRRILVIDPNERCTARECLRYRL